MNQNAMKNETNELIQRNYFNMSISKKNNNNNQSFYVFCS